MYMLDIWECVGVFFSKFWLHLDGCSVGAGVEKIFDEFNPLHNIFLCL